MLELSADYWKKLLFLMICIGCSLGCIIPDALANDVVHVTKDIEPESILVGACSDSVINFQIDLNIQVPSSGGMPVDIMLVIDRSSTMMIDFIDRTPV